MGPQPGSDALLAKENLHARFLVIYVGAPAASPSARHENGKLAMKTEFSCVRDAAPARPTAY